MSSRREVTPGAQANLGDRNRNVSEADKPAEASSLGANVMAGSGRVGVASHGEGAVLRSMLGLG
jgi:hypothetical protein